MRVVLDTNVLVSMTLAPSGSFEPAWSAWRAGRFEVAVCDQLLAETFEVLSRPKFTNRLTRSDSDLLKQFLLRRTLNFSISEPYPNFSDPKDRFLLELLEVSRADALVTGDRALQALRRWETALIATPAEFLTALA